MRSPRNRISPEVGAWAPTRHEKSVVLPAPFGPMTPKISPDATSNETSVRAARPPKRFVTPRTESSALRRHGPPPPAGSPCERRRA